MKKMLNPKVVLLTAALLCVAAPIFAQGLSMTGRIPERPTKDVSWNDTLKAGFNRFTKAVLPDEKPPEKLDELSLARKAKASPELHTALAQACEQRGETQSAIAEYEKALKLDPKHEDTLLKFARFYDRINQTSKAEELYQKAIQIHSRSANVFNHHGLFYVRHKRYADAAQAFSTAVTLEPMKETYRGNLAVVLVDLGKYKKAYLQLKTIQTSDMAYYNLGYLLQERGQKELAIKHFQVALQKNPNHKEAQIWLAHLLEEQRDANLMLAVQRTRQPVTPPVQQNPPITPIQPHPTQQNVAQQNHAQQNIVTPQPRIGRQMPSWETYTKAPVDANQPNRSIQRPQQPNLGTPPLPTSQPVQTPAIQQQQQPVEQHPMIQQQQPIQATPPWQPSLPPETTGPMRTYSHYRTTVPPTRQQPYVIPDPSRANPNLPARNRTIPLQPAQPNQQVQPNQPVQPTTTQAEPPTLITPAGSRIIARRLPPVSQRNTVNTSSDRYITPLPPVDWSNQPQGRQ